jgi:serine/threonine protein kinase
MIERTGASELGQVAQLFHALVDLDEPQRSVELQRRCAGDPRLEEKVRCLLGRDGGHTDLPSAPSVRVRSTTRAEILSGANVRGGALQPVRLLGCSSVASVLLARSIGDATNRWVAVKVLQPTFQAETGVRACLWREIAALSVLRHPLIPRLVEHGETSEGSPWLATEYIEGRSILDHVRHFGLPMRDRIQLFCTLLDALAHAHECGITHGDFKNSNTLVSANHSPYLIDFGACFNRSADAVVSEHNYPLALTPSCAAPEQTAGEPPTSRSDVYSAGLLLQRLVSLEVGRYEMSKRKPPIRSWKNPLRSNAAFRSRFRRRQAYAPIVEVSVVAGWSEWEHLLVREIGGLIEIAMSPDPLLRYRDASEFREALLSLLWMSPCSPRAGTMTAMTAAEAS